MIPILLFVLFFVLFASRTLGFDLSLLPGVSVKNAFLYLIFLTLAIETALTRRRKLELMPVFVPFALYMLYAVFTFLVVVLIVNYPGYDFLQAAIALKAGPIEFLLVFMIFFYGASDSEQALRVLRNIVWLVIAGNVITVLDGLNIVSWGLIELREDGRVGGPLGSSNEYGSFLALYLPAIFALYMTAKSGLLKVLAGIGALVSALAFLMALSRGAIVGLAAGGLVGAWYMRGFISSKAFFRSGLITVFVGAAVIAGGFAVGYGDLVLDRFAQFGGGSYDATSGRTVIWGKAVGSMLQNPITFVTGFGWYSYQSSIHFGFATHNEYLDILYNLGIIGLSLFLLIAWNAVRIARSSLRSATDVERAFIMAFIFGFLSLLASIVFGEIYSAGLYVWAYVGISLRIAIAALESPVAETVAIAKPGQSRQSGISHQPG